MIITNSRCRMRYFKLLPKLLAIVLCFSVIYFIILTINSGGYVLVRGKSLILDKFEYDAEARKELEIEYYIRRARPFQTNYEREILLFDGVAQEQPKLFDELTINARHQTLHDRIQEILMAIPLDEQKKLIESFPKPGEPNGNIIKLYQPIDF